MDPVTPYYLIDEKRLLRNLKIVERVRKLSGAKSVLALKCFSTWCVFDLMRPYLDGTTSSSLFEARLGREKFGKEVHAYSVAYSEEEITQVAKSSDKIIFNSLSQFERLRQWIPAKKPIGLRINPQFSYSHYDLANPARKFSRLGVTDKAALEKAAPLLTGIMFHFNCENDDFDHLSASLDQIGADYGPLLKRMQWVSLGGGIAFTKKDYPLAQFCKRLKDFGRAFDVQVYLEPGEAVITECAELVTTILDVVHNEIDIAIVDASMEAHMLDHLIYRTHPRLAYPSPGPHQVIIAGRSCLAGDVFGQFGLRQKLRPGSTVRIADAAGYTMVKKNWFNGLPMPSICVKRLDGTLDVVRRFSYKDFVSALS